MYKRLMAMSVLAGSVLAFGSVAAAEKGPGYMYDTYGKPAKDSQGECVKSVYREKDAYPECEAVAKAEKVTERLTLDAKTLFDFDKSNLRPEGKAKLDDVLARAKAAGVTVDKIDVVGHTDSIGSDAYNQALSERRASTVKNYLAEKGVPASKIVTKGMGESQPVADNKTSDGRQLNRRVEIAVEKTVVK
jgi:OOP family OmpA-OmpF porin